MSKAAAAAPGMPTFGGVGPLVEGDEWSYVKAERESGLSLDDRDIDVDSPSG